MQRINRHPPVLPYLFLTELWERFGFYVVQGLLVLYLTQSFGFTDTESYTITGLFSAIVYISPFFGGIIADRLLGFEKTIIIGGLFLVAGYATLAIPFYQTTLFYPALSLIIIGNGLFKPNISSLLGTQYDKSDPKREAGFTIFYIGINIGVLLAGISSGYIKEWYGTQLSFAFASVGLIIGIFTFLAGIKKLKNPHTEPAKNLFPFFLCAFIAVALITLLFRFAHFSSLVLPIAGVLLLLYLTKVTLQQQERDKHGLILLIILILSSIIFWALFLQLFFSANLFVDRLVDKNFFGFHITTTIFYASESIFIILLGPLFAWGWGFLGRNQLNPTPINKFALGLLFTGFGFLLLGKSAFFMDAHELIHPLWVFGAYFLITIGELLISPIGLSSVTLLSPANLVGMMMGVWFVATGFGGLLAGNLAKMASVPEEITATTGKLAIYHEAFMNFAYIAFVVAAILLLLNLLFKSWINEGIK